MLDEIVWLFNIRGFDIEFNPVVISYCIVTLQHGIHFFIDGKKLSAEVTGYLTAPAPVSSDQTSVNGDIPFNQTVTIHAYEDITTFINKLKQEQSSMKLLADPTQLNWKIYNTISVDHVKDCVNPVTLMKSLKNPQELAGVRQSHIRDGVALTAFLCHLEKLIQTECNVVPVVITGKKTTRKRKTDDEVTGVTGDDSATAVYGEDVMSAITEFQVTEMLETFRSKMPLHVSPSFDTIAGT